MPTCTDHAAAPKADLNANKKTNPAFLHRPDGRDTERAHSLEPAGEKASRRGISHRFSKIPVFSGSPVRIQPKLKINTPGDIYEQEADRMADRVMRMAESDLPETSDQKGESGIIQRKCATCQAADKSEDEEEIPLMRKADAGAGMEASPELEAQLKTAQGGGEPLPNDTRNFMERAFGADFSDVRVHADEQAAEMNRGIRARAFTYGSNIYFNKGEFVPESHKGRKLLAHELAHVVQQNENTHASVQCNEEDAGSEFGVQLGELLPESAVTEGPVQSETIEKALAYLATVRQIITDVHNDVNTLINLVDQFEGLVSEEFFNSEFVLTVLYEGLDAVSVILPENLEAGATIVAKTILVIVMNTERVKQAKAANRQSLNRINEISGLIDALVEARISVDEMKNRVQYEPGLSSLLASQPIPEIPGRVSRLISKEIEFSLLVAMIRRSGGRISTDQTDEVIIPDGELFTDTELYKNALSRHYNPEDNFYLRCSHHRNEFSLFRLGSTGNVIYNLSYYFIDDIEENIVHAVLKRLKHIEVPKERLFFLMLGSALQFRCNCTSCDRVDE